MVELLKALALASTLCWALPANSSIDCNPVEKANHGPDIHAVIAYADKSAIGQNAEELQRYIEGTVLLDYMQSLGIESSSVKRLIFLLCGSDRGEDTLTTRLDIDTLHFYRVKLVVWRSQEGNKRVVAHAVVPEAHRNKQKASDHEVVLLDTTAATDPLESWQQAVVADRAGLSSLLGLGLGLHYLSNGEGPAAKLVLCKSRKDLQRAFANLVRPPKLGSQLDGVLKSLQDDADKLIASDRTPASAALQQRVLAACSP